MRWSVVLLCVASVLLFGSVISFSSSDSDAVSGSGIMISEVDPSDEAVSIVNNGSSAVDLKGYSVTDGEGTLTFTSSHVLAAGQRLTISKETGTDWFNSRSDTYAFGSSSFITKKGSFILADSGDEVSILNGETLVDSVCYGKSEGVDGWTGTAAKISSGQYLLRTGTDDTDSDDDWVSTKPGWTNLEFSDGLSFEAEVTPFSFPESGGVPVLEALSEAEQTIDISIYLLSSPQVVALLCQKESSGVEVRVLVDGCPLGVDISTEISLLRTLADSGGEVRIINYSGSSDCRYSYVHNKYAVIDQDTVVVTSENWTAGNIGGEGNRGWGVVIGSPGYASCVEEIFENDYSTEWGDVKTLLEVYPNAKPYADLEYHVPSAYQTVTYTASVTPVFSPDDSYAALREMIGSSETRLYVEQMDLGSSLSSVTGDTPIAWMSAAADRGVDVKYILDSSQSNGSAHETYVNLITSASSIQAITVNGGNGFDLIHNKGLVIDDSVWVGSVNWTDTSFGHNREIAVRITSEEVSDYFTSLFLEDFGVNIYTVEETGLQMTASVVDTSDGPKVLLSASGPEGYSYEWSVGDVTRTSEYSSALFDPSGTGTFTVSVHLVGTDLYDSTEVTVTGESSGPDYDWIVVGSCLVAVLVLALGFVVAYLNELRERKRRRGGMRPGRLPYKPI